MLLVFNLSYILYGIQVYHYNSLPNYLSLSLERVQKRALKIIYGYDNHYREALQMAGLKTLKDRREDLCLKLFNSIVSNPLDFLYHLLPFDNRDQLMELRRRRPFIEFPLKQTGSEILGSFSNYDGNGNENVIS